MQTTRNPASLNELRTFASYNKGYVKLGEGAGVAKRRTKPDRPPPYPAPQAGLVDITPISPRLKF